MAEEPKKPEDETPPAETAAESPPPADGDEPPPDEEPPRVEAEPTEPRSSGGWGRAFVAAALVVVLVLGGAAVAGYLTYPTWAPKLLAAVNQGLRSSPDTAPVFAAPKAVAELRETVTRLHGELGKKDQEIASLRERVQALDGAVTQLRQTPPAAERPVSAEPALVEELNRRIGRIEATLDADRAASREAIARVNQELARIGGGLQSANAAVKDLEAAMQRRKDADAQSRLLVIALSQLSAALAGSEPFEPLLTSLRAVGGQDGPLAEATEALRPYAGKGIPSRAQLRDRFDTVARDAVQAQSAPQGEGWIDRTLARLSNLVSVRTVGEGAEPRNPADAAVANAERSLGDGNLGAAVEALSTLQGAPAKAVEGWLADARARLAAERAVAALNERAKTALAEAGG